MKKIILIIITFLFCSAQSFATSVGEWTEKIENLIEELKSSNYTFEIDENLWNAFDREAYYSIYYEGTPFGSIILNTEGLITFNLLNKNNSSWVSDNQFTDQDFPVWHLLYYFPEYKDKSKVISWIVNDVYVDRESRKISLFPWEKGSYLISIDYKWTNGLLFPTHLLRSYIEDFNCTQENYYNCMLKVQEQFEKDINLEIKLIKSPDFVKLKDKKIIEINLEAHDYSSIWNHSLEFEVWIDWEKWFTKEITIEVLKPIILAIWEIWIEWWFVRNDWKDIEIVSNEWPLDRSYKVAYIMSSDWQVSMMMSTPVIPEEFMLNFRFNQPPREIVAVNYLSWDTYWTTAYSQTLSYEAIEEKTATIYNTCVRDTSKTDTEKYECYKEYMWLWVVDETSQKDEELLERLDLSKAKIEKSVFKQYLSVLDEKIESVSLVKLKSVSQKLNALDISKYKKLEVLIEYMKVKVDYEIYVKE